MICQKEKAICRCGCGGRVIQVDMAVFHCDRCRVGFHIPPHPNGWANMKIEGMIRKAVRASILKQARKVLDEIWRKIKKAFRRKKKKTGPRFKKIEYGPELWSKPLTMNKEVIEGIEITRKQIEESLK